MPARDLRHLLQTATDCTPSQVQTWADKTPLRYRFRVLQSGRFFRCCHCNRLYPRTQIAWACVVEWARTQIPELNVEFQVHGTQVRYVCPMCRKIFSSHLDAQHCLTHCIGEVTATLPDHIDEADQALLTEILRRSAPDYVLTDVLPHVQHSNRSATAAPILPTVARRVDSGELRSEAWSEPSVESSFAGEPEAEPAFDNDLIPNQDPAIDSAEDFGPEEAAIDSEPEEDDVIYRKKGLTKSFVREGAKYRCTVCATQYFTQAEVRACFESHPEEP